MKILIVSASRRAESVIDAHVRNSNRIFDLLSAAGHVVDMVFFFEKPKIKDCDVVIFSYATYYPDLNLYKRVFAENPKAQFIWVTNEYNLVINSIVQKSVRELGRRMLYIRNFYQDTAPKEVDVEVLNLNLLIFDPARRNTPKKYDCCYYGTFRQDRVKYFKRYLQNGVYVSTSPANFKKYKLIGCKPFLCEKFSWKKQRETLGNFRFSLYIEDEFTHTHFNFLANRFYEALMTNTVVLFDADCESTLKAAKITNYDSFIVHNHKELIERAQAANYDELYKLQMLWHKDACDQKTAMEKQLVELITTYKS